MPSKKVSKSAVLVLMDRGYALVSPKDWAKILKEARVVDSITRCATWGEYRKLGKHPFQDAINDWAQLEEDPGDDEPFLSDFPFDDVSEGAWSRHSELEMATQDFLESISDHVDLSEFTEAVGPWSWIDLDHDQAVCDLIKSLGFEVIEGEFD
jgi:hypothetical protein